jgi:hypothetical protein
MPKDPKKPSPVPDLFPADELSTGETSSLLKRAKLVTGFQDDPAPEVDPSLKPTTGRFLALKAAADSAKLATGTAPALEPLPPRPGATGSMPAFRPGTGQQPTYQPSAPRPGTDTRPAFNPSAPRPRPSTGTHTVLDPDALRREIRSRSLHDPSVAPSPGARPARPVKPPLAAEDTFVKKKMRQAENNLPDWDFDMDGDEVG